LNVSQAPPLFTGSVPLSLSPPCVAVAGGVVQGNVIRNDKEYVCSGPLAGRKYIVCFPPSGDRPLAPSQKYDAPSRARWGRSTSQPSLWPTTIMATSRLTDLEPVGLTACGGCYHLSGMSAPRLSYSIRKGRPPHLCSTRFPTFIVRKSVVVPSFFHFKFNEHRRP
jgi:hypothetical protein